jgi:uncharacterized membrane protein YgaE (UPF0421/DUF939 family)
MMPENVAMNVLLILVAVGILMSLVCIVMYALFNRKVKNAIEGVLKAVEDTDKEVRYLRKLFDAHFKITDGTIKDTRKERDYWKSRALTEKKSATLKK